MNGREREGKAGGMGGSSSRQADKVLDMGETDTIRAQGDNKSERRDLN